MITICEFCKEEKQHYAKGLCKNCYNRKQRKGTCEYHIKQTQEEILKRARERANKYRQENPEKVKQSQKEYYLKNKEKISNYKKQLYLNKKKD